MPATAVTRSDTDKAIVTRKAVFIKELRNGAFVYIREPYDIVEYDRSHQATGAVRLGTYAQPRGGIVRPNPAGTGYAEIGTDRVNDVEEVYDELLILDRPDPGSPYRR
jgi:hypothetical protein